MPAWVGLKIKNSPGRGAKISASKKGKRFTDEHKKALSEAKRGKPIKHLIDNWDEIRAKISKAQKGIPRPYQRGENSGNWKGGATSKTAAIRNSFEMKQWRGAVFKRDNYTCQKCGNVGDIHAHHIKPFCDYPDLRFDVNNGITLCIICHGNIHNKDFTNRRNKICIDCGAKIINKSKTGLCGSCSIKRSWVIRKQNMVAEQTQSSINTNQKIGVII